MSRLSSNRTVRSRAGGKGAYIESNQAGSKWSVVKEISLMWIDSSEFAQSELHREARKVEYNMQPWRVGPLTQITSNSFGCVDLNLFLSIEECRLLMAHLLIIWNASQRWRISLSKMETMVRFYRGM